MRLNKWTGLLVVAVAGCSPKSDQASPGQSQGAKSTEAAALDSARGAAAKEAAHAATADSTSRASRVYVCPMHPEVTSASPGKCPKCGMELVEKS